MFNYGNFFAGLYADGAKTTTSLKPLVDGSIELYDNKSQANAREQIKWLNVNGNDISSIVNTLVNKSVGVSIITKVESADKNFNKEAEEVLTHFSKVGVGELTGRHHFNRSARLIANFILWTVVLL